MDRHSNCLLRATGFGPQSEGRDETPVVSPQPGRRSLLALVRVWLGTWSGIGLVAAGMARQGYDLSLTRYDERGWRATFYVKRDGALGHGRDRLGLRVYPLGGSTASRVGDASGRMIPRRRGPPAGISLSALLD